MSWLARHATSVAVRGRAVLLLYAGTAFFGSIAVTFAWQKSPIGPVIEHAAGVTSAAVGALLIPPVPAPAQARAGNDARLLLPEPVWLESSAEQPFFPMSVPETPLQPVAEVASSSVATPGPAVVQQEESSLGADKSAEEQMEQRSSWSAGGTEGTESTEGTEAAGLAASGGAATERPVEIPPTVPATATPLPTVAFQPVKNAGDEHGAPADRRESGKEQSEREAQEERETQKARVERQSQKAPAVQNEREKHPQTPKDQSPPTPTVALPRSPESGNAEKAHAGSSSRPPSPQRHNPEPQKSKVTAVGARSVKTPTVQQAPSTPAARKQEENSPRQPTNAGTASTSANPGISTNPARSDRSENSDRSPIAHSSMQRRR